MPKSLVLEDVMVFDVRYHRDCRTPNSHSASMIYDGMLVLQHRGQDAAGIVTSDSENITHRRANGLVRDVFTEKHMQKLTGSMGIGHVRYPYCWF